MRLLLKLAGVGSLTVFIVGAILVVLNWNRITTLAQNLGAVFDGAEIAVTLNSVESLLAYIDTNRTRVSLVAYPPDDADSAILLNPDIPRPLASAIKILVLAGYAEAVGRGRWSPDERVLLTAVEAFYLPHTDGGAHERAVEIYRERGWLDAAGRVALQRVAWAMITVSDNAATDYLLDRLGRGRAETLPARFNTSESEAPLPISGIFLSWSAAGNDSLADAAWGLAERLRDDPEFRTARQNDPVVNRITIREQARMSSTRLPKGTARDYTDLMARVLRGELTSSVVSATMRGFLEWPMEKEPVRRAFGGKSGNLPGVLTEVIYAVPRDATSGGVATLLLDDLPLAIWVTLKESRLHQELLRRLLSDHDFFVHVRQRLDTKTPGHGRDPEAVRPVAGEHPGVLYHGNGR